MRGGNHMDNQLPELKVNMLGRFSITYGEQPITFKRNSATKAVKLLQILLHSSLVEDRGSTGIPSEYSCAMKSHFRKFGNQMSGSGNHLCNYASLLA